MRSRSIAGSLQRVHPQHRRLTLVQLGLLVCSAVCSAVWRHRPDFVQWHLSRGIRLAPQRALQAHGHSRPLPHWRRCASCRAAIGAALEADLRVLDSDEVKGGGWLLTNLALDRDQNLTLVLDTGVTEPLILSKSAWSEAMASGTSSSGTEEVTSATGSVTVERVTLQNLQLPYRDDDGSQHLSLGQVDAVIVEELPQQQYGLAQNITVHGLLGQGLLALFDVEVDPEQSLLRLYPAGTVSTMSESDNDWHELPLIPLPGDLAGVILRTPTSEEGVVSIIDCGASFTVINQAAAQALGLSASAAMSKARGACIDGIGLAGTVSQMPLVPLGGIELCAATGVSMNVKDPRAEGGAATSSQGPNDRRFWKFDVAPCESGQCARPLDRVELAVGDIDFFEQLLSETQDSIGDFRGPCALLGQDLLSQRPWRLSMRSGKLWLGREDPGQ